MKIVVERNKFLSALNIIKDVSGGNEILQILQNVKMETNGDDGLLLTATNIDQTVVSSVKCQIKEPGVTTVPARLLVQMVGAITTPMVEFSHTDNSAKAVLVGGDVTYKIATIDAKDFPIPAEVNGKEIQFTKGELKDMFRKTAFASSVDGTRRSLVSVCFQTSKGNVSAVATDGRRLAVMKMNKEAEDGLEMIVPTASIKFLQRLLAGDGDVTVNIDSGKSVKFSSEGWMVQSKLIDDSYPSWEKILPTDYVNRIAVDRNIFADAVRQVSLSSSADNTNITISFKNGMMTLTASTDAVSDAKAMIPVKYDGEEIKAHINPHYILDVLGAYDADTVSFNITDGTKPISITSEEADCLTVIMPLRVN